MSKLITKTIKIKSNTMPPNLNFIEEEIAKRGLNSIRWSIVKVENNTLTINVSASIQS